MTWQGAPSPPLRRLDLPALEAFEGGTPLAKAQLTDQQRLAVVLEAAALLGHLQAADQHLATPWQDAHLDDVGRLRVGPSTAGALSELPQSQLVRLLLFLFQSEHDIAGRGEARRAGRHLLRRWRQDLTPMTPRDAVADIFEQAGFLWQPGFAEQRKTLAAQLEIETEDGQVTPSPHLVAPARARHRLMAHGKDVETLHQVLASPRAQDLWEGSPSGDPRALASQGRWEQANAVWRRQPPADADESLAYAQSLFAVGRYGQVLDVLKRHQRFEAVRLRLWSQVYLGEIDAALKTLHGTRRKRLTAQQTLRLGEVAIRILAARRRDDDIRDWVANCHKVAKGPLKLDASLLAAEAAWDREAWEDMWRHLESAEEARHDKTRAGRWHHLMGLWARATGDALRSVEHMERALGSLRPRVGPVEAGRLWNDLAIIRATAGDLAGSERACRHAVRLLRHSEGPGRTTLALYNLAEVRIRRGRLEGVEVTLEASTAANRRSKNARGLIYDLELWVRFELAQGRCSAALARCSEAEQGFDGATLGDRAQVFALFAARAQGWQGRQDLAAAHLGRTHEAAIRELDEEERPAVFALAGLKVEAGRWASESPWRPLWDAVLAGHPPTAEAWRTLDRLEPFRAARLICDCEWTLPGSVPSRRIRWAVRTLQKCGADGLAERLENRSQSPWDALSTFLDLTEPSPQDASALLEAAGYPTVRLRYITPDTERTLIEGPETSCRLQTQWGEGHLVLEAPLEDRPLHTLLQALRRRLEPPEPTRPAPSGDEAVIPRPVFGSGMVGSSPQLLDAIGRIQRLASSRLPMLLLGDSGTGKELAAHMAHRHSPRAEGPFLPINCAAISEDLIQSDLFGHVRGAFTGADRDRAGIFESARSGTVFLDEIGDLPLTAQGKLLRVLQENEVRRVGESFARKVDVRVVTATHRDLEAMVDEGTFRRDLYFRLKAATVRLPPLKERGHDVLKLAEHFLESYRRDMPHLSLSDGSRQRLLNHDWPGNVRELKNTLEVAAALAEGGRIETEHLELPQKEPLRQGEYHRLVLDYRRRLVEDALKQSDGNRAEAARHLGLSRQALSYLVRQLGLS